MQVMQKLWNNYAKNMQKLRKNYEKKNYAKITHMCVNCIICIIMHPLLNHHDVADGGEGQQLTSGRLGCFI